MLQLRKALYPITFNPVALLRSKSLSKLLQPSKALSPIVSKLVAPRFKSPFNFIQPWKAYPPILVKLLGSFKLPSKFLQPSKAYCLIVVKPVAPPRSTLPFNPVQPLKAPPPILVKLPGSFNLGTFTQPWKALFPIALNFLALLRSKVFLEFK